MTEEGSEEEIELFAEHARWLIAFHDSRGESLSTRAVALLGFVGVILALLLGSGLLDGAEKNFAVEATFVLTVALLLTTSACCVATLKTRQLRVPGVEQSRRNWRSWVTKERRGSAAKDIAEALLRAKDLDEDSTVDWVVRAGSARASWFGRAVILMGLSLASLTVLLVIVGARI